MPIFLIKHFNVILAAAIFVVPIGLWVGVTALYQFLKHRKVMHLNQSGLHFQRWAMWDQAVAEFKKAVECDGADAISRYNLGYALYFGKGAWLQALAQFDKAIGANRRMAEAYYARGHILFHCEKDAEHAKTDLAAAVNLDPQIAEAHNTLGLIEIESRNWEAAAGEFEAATSQRADYEAAFSNLGIAYVNLGRNIDAITALEKCVELSPAKTLCYNNLGNAYGACRMHDKAIGAFRKALELDETNWSSYFWLACVLYQTGKAAEAVPHFHRALHVRGEFALAHYNLALCYEALAMKGPAKKHMDLAIELDPEIGKDLI